MRFSLEDERFMRRALALASQAYGATSPNPMVGAVIVRNGEIVGEGWHKKAGEPHAEINALAAARKKGFDLQGATIYITLEPCSTLGRTPPCTDALIESGITRVVVGATDPNPKHAGAAYRLLRKHRLRVEHGLLAEECTALNEAFNHWIVTGLPFVTLKCAMSLDGKIATNSGESKWITDEKARAFGLRLRLGADAILCGIHTVLRDDPSLMLRAAPGVKIPPEKRFQRIILDRDARIPLSAKVLSDEHASRTILIVSSAAAARKVRELEKRVRVMVIPRRRDRCTFKLKSLLETLAADNVTSLLVEGGGETHANFLAQKLAQRVCFFYAPMIITGRSAPKAVAGEHTINEGKGFRLDSAEWKTIGRDLLLTGLVRY
jgi:diaminohydroxyphosphoribosylaminopyrimidine deaminase / 5-amino-6-(5-phosphoribosylamino)uracil reductase